MPPPRRPARAWSRLRLARWRAAMRVLTAVATTVNRFRLGGCTVSVERYGEHPLETLQRIQARSVRPDGHGRLPVVYVHGGGWIGGCKEIYEGELAYLARRGHAVFNVDYALAPADPFPRPLASVLRALAHVRGQLEAGGDAAPRVHLVGDSAGGNLVCMAGILARNPDLRADLMGLDPACADVADLALPAIERVVSLYGVLDRRSWLERRFPMADVFLECYGGPGAAAPDATPSTRLTPLDLDLEADLAAGAAGHPPLLLAAGTRDPLCRSTELAHAALAARGGEVRLALYPGEGHAFFSYPWNAQGQALKRDLAAFLDDALPPTPAEIAAAHGHSLS